MLEVRARRKLGDFLLDVAFQGPADGVTVLIGPSGAGKSATLSVIAGALRADDARIVLGERVLTHTSQHSHVPPERRRIGLVHQDARLFPHMPVSRNLLYGWTRARGERRIAVDDVVDVLGIGHLMERRTQDLSGGERQRVALGRALLSQPDLLLLDEPVSALDPALRSEVLDFIVDLKREFRLPMVYVTHSDTEARMLGDVIVRLEAGRVVAMGSAADILPEPRLEGLVIDHDATGTTVSFAGRLVHLPRLNAPPGATVRLDWKA